jgi:hypothetical protein
MPRGPDRDRVEAALRRIRARGVDRDRVDEALRRAAQNREESERLLAAARERRQRQYLLSCAWCGRYLVDGAYVEPPSLEPFHVTHGICPACLAELRRTGRSR